MPDIIARVYDRAAPATLLGTLTADRARQWLHQLSDVGHGQLNVHKDHADAAVLTYDAIVRFRLNGVDRFAFLVEQRQRHTLATARADEEIEVSGRGVLALLDFSPVYPELGLGVRSPDHRYFNFASRDFDSSAWSTAVQIKQQSDDTFGQWETTDDSGTHQAPSDFPDPDAWWIWSQSQGVGTSMTPPQPVGDVYFVQRFTLANQTPVAILISADDGFRVYLDDDLVAEEIRAFMWADTKRVDVLLDAGEHVLAVKATNIVREIVDANVAGVIWTVVQVTEGGDAFGSVICHSDDTVLCLDYPAEAPTMTPGQILRVLVTEAQDRGELDGVTVDFDDDVDSDGTTWSGVDVVYAVGTTSLLQVAKQLAEQAIDVEMTAALVLRAWVRGGQGGASGVTLVEGVDYYSVDHDGEGPLATGALIRTAEGRWIEAVRAASVTAHGRRIAGLQLGTAASDDQAARTAEAVFDDHAEPVDDATYSVAAKAGAAPYADWTVGDTVGLLASDESTAATRVMALAVGEDDEGHATYKATARQVAS